MKNNNSLSSSFEQIYSNFIDPNGSVMIVSHRGNWRQAPENSIQAIQYSIDSGVDMIEIDINKTKDGVLIVMHDDTVDRMTNGSGQIADLTFEEISSFRLKEGQGSENIITNESVPTLEEVMLFVKDKVMVNLDKCWNIREDVYRILVKTGTVRQGLFKSTAEMDEVEEFIAGKVEPPEYMQIIDESNMHQTGQLEQMIKRIKPKAFELSFMQDDSVNISEEALTQMKGKCRVWVNTMWDSLCAGHSDEISLTNPKLGWGWHLVRGANMIQTDSPGQLYDYLNQTIEEDMTLGKEAE